MKNFIIIIVVFILFGSCKEKQKSAFSLQYIEDKKDLYLQFKNNTNQDIIFLVPNSLEFGDKNFHDLTTQGGKEGDYPINVYAVIDSGQSSEIYQQKLDSIHDAYLTEIGNGDFIGDERPGDGNSVFYLKNNKTIKVKYNMTIKPIMIPSKKIYSSTFKQNYYPYDKVLKGEYPDGEYLRRFSKLNFGKAKFVAQPVIEDTLFLRLSEKDVTD
ncbi:hypothetical protein [Chryseobacterium rhizosphaerae]|uniref:hypothetical protein n=1 Tax=Chryseobacterium rhizosphaerae TaxID=395937 RepID=UPI00235A17D6|nr:hypothetical protein [Chryseobacterium rhizosphaerae]MDC8101638.1 hypothetical protein [Chryseobacterium rhizosphaerae]